MKKSLLVLTIIFLCTGCFLDPYKNEDNAVDAVNAWFSYVNGEDDLGVERRKIENIHTIKGVSCEYIENDEYLRYVYRCEIAYSPIGETVIPLAKDEVMNVYVVLSYNDDRTYNYVVYNSNSEDDIWRNDEYLRYGLERLNK